MSWLSRKKPGRTSGEDSPRAQRKAAIEFLTEWTSARRGVEAYVEPKTSVTPVTVLLVAHDGEFTRKPVDSPDAAKNFAHDLEIPVYDATIVGYPQRMRDYSRRHKIMEERAQRKFLGDL
ncbi:hypothetical protein ABIB25_004598 [Nakamurella sp. UYEF19]|uniref:hypothetical protein n=1 Tax=Nakamurella sp. UYEF19 TaxID=1756392 RepID=UPI003394B1A4